MKKENPKKLLTCRVDAKDYALIDGIAQMEKVTRPNAAGRLLFLGLGEWRAQYNAVQKDRKRRECKRALAFRDND